MMEIYNNEKHQKTGGQKEEIPEELDIIELETEGKSSRYTYDATPDANRPFSLSEWMDTESFPPSNNSMVLGWRQFTTEFMG